MTQYNGQGAGLVAGTSATDTFAGVMGLQFEVTTAGQNLYGLYWYVSSPQSTVSQNIALWSVSGGVGTYVTGSKTATGTMTPGSGTTSVLVADPAYQRRPVLRLYLADRGERVD